MNKILLALTLLGAGAGGFLTARQSTTQLQHEANTTREAWLVQTQLVADAQNDQAGLVERIRELKQTLVQPPAVAENALWSALQTNGVGHLTPELRERLREELGFNWQSSPDYIVVSQETVRDLDMPVLDSGRPIRGKVPGEGKVTDIAGIVLALTPAERGQIEAAKQGAQTDYKEWALAHVERSEPKDDVVAQYTLPYDPAMSESISNNFVTRVREALGRERAELIWPSARDWMQSIGIKGLGPGGIPGPETMMVKRSLVGNEQRLGAFFFRSSGTNQYQYMRPRSGGNYGLPLAPASFPVAFRPIFPNGWDDVAKREGFELPTQPQ